MSSTFTVALAGATGSLGSKVLEELLAAGFPVTVLTRTDSGSASKLPKSSQITVKEVDYSSVDSLKAALQGVKAVVSTLTFAATDGQNPLMDAAVEAGVTRFIPSEFGSDSENPKTATLPVTKGKVDVHKYLAAKAKSNPSFSYTPIINNAYLDWGLQHDFLMNPHNHTATLYDGGDRPFSTTTLRTVAKGVVGVFKNLDATKNRAVRIHDTITTQKKLIELIQKIEKEKYGSAKEWETTEMTTEEAVRSSHEELKKGNPYAMYGFLPACIYGEGYGGVFKDNLDNDLLGIKEMSDKEVEAVVAELV